MGPRAPAALGIALAAGFGGVLLALIPRVLELEEQVGLAALFRMRPAAAAPEGVVVVAMSSETADRYGLSDRLFEWPRQYHAEVVRKLSAAGAEGIVFDIAFERPGEPEEDAQFAAAIRDAGNVLLLERLEIRDLELPGLDGSARRIEQIPIVEAFADAAVGRAPLMLPTFPIRTSQFWVFGAGSSDSPTLVALALQVALHGEMDDLIGLIRSVAPEAGDSLPATDGRFASGGDIQKLMRQLRGFFLRRPDLGARLIEELRTRELASATHERLAALIATYAGPDSRYANYYGPSGTVRTIAYEDILDADPAEWEKQDLAGHVVFVGYSERRQSEQQDEFVTIYSERTGLSLHGVEIGATAYANLLARDWIEPLTIPAQVALILAFGVGTTLLLSPMRLLPQLALGGLAGAGYLAAALALFAGAGIWLPLVVPLGVQLPVILVAMMLAQYRAAVRQRERIQIALGHYVPPSEVSRLVHDTLEPRADESVVHGTCLLSDVRDYTALAEGLEPDELARMMRGYFATLSDIVRSNGGFVTDVSGDSMVGVWTAAADDESLRRRALGAALEIVAAGQGDGEACSGSGVATAVGLEAGRVALSQYVQGDRYVYRAVGDIVNTAARIQGLNRFLGTHVLASRDACLAGPAWRTRELGRFLMLGKSTAIDVLEILPADSRLTERLGPHLATFAEGLASFRSGRFEAARAAFGEILSHGLEDGPSRFYFGQCGRLAARPPGGGWDGTVRLDAK